ncbi:thioesterase [Streptomyces spinoverrucosus]|uniref:Thioesterase n=1 Tax=Streptomyces spinoverrucosus TaxID=284043 RepID=A0A4Y3VY67_9ACTN|nr:alpha/beta fold hydrolase [Streptomyces spinoverrucosus]GEC10619.1 thioesterase [Streptomyces spinoverrucosus]GHB74786.1 thioesterase [Streptomyces spinoverrucosus]
MGNEWFRRIGHPTGAVPSEDRAPRLYCFPHAGGAAGSFLPLARALTPHVDVLAAQYPGRQDRRREQPLADIGLLAEALVAHLPLQDERPYAFFGHSMGAVLAYEVARLLQERHRPGPAALVLSGRRAPTPQPSPYDRLRTDADILRAIRGLGGTTPQLLDDPEIRDMVMPALRADYRAIGSYAWQPGPPLSIPFTVLVGDRDPVVAVAEARAWQDFTTAPTGLHVFDGGHFFLDAHLPRVAETVLDALDHLTAVPASR